MAKNLSARAEDVREGFNPWVRKIPWRRAWQPIPILLPGKPRGQRSLVGYSPRGRKESDMTERLHFHFFLSNEELLFSRRESTHRPVVT